MRALTIMLFITICLSACRGSSAPRIRGLEGYSLEQHFDLIGGEFSVPFAKSGDSISSRDEWIDLVADERRSGLARLPLDRRRALLVGALKAFLVSVHDVRYGATLNGGGSGTLTDAYARNPAGLYTVELARSVQTHAIVFTWPAPPPSPYEGGTREERWLFNSDSRETENHWVIQNGSWRCDIVKGRGDTQLFESVILLEMQAVIDGEVGPRGLVRGRSAVAIDTTYFERSMRVWLDETTLWPIRFEFARRVDYISGVNETATLPKAIVTLEEINGDLHVSPPTNITPEFNRC